MSYRGKIILLGDPYVGKTSLLARYVDDEFHERYSQTLGANFMIKEVELTDIIDKLDNLNKDLKEKIRDKGFKVYFWDIGGQRDKLFANEYYFLQAVGAIVVFNLVDKESLENLEFWITKLKNLSGDIPFIIIGNKNDLSGQETISEKQIEDTLNQYHVEYFQTSAKTNENVRKAFESLAIKVLNNLE